jgi:N-acetylmuramoyl-L-alanine amidase
MDKSLRAVRGIVIDPGHGGSDPGAVGNNMLEKNLNLEVSRYMYDRFNQLGIPVVLTRSSDETLDSTERVNRILNAFGNNSDVIVISNHINAGGGDGQKQIYALRNNSTLQERY